LYCRHIHIDKSILHFALTHQHWQKLICHCLFLPTIYRYFPVVARFDFLDGFGLTYVLPVIVLILKAKPGDFIIVENPESHLHPAGQAKIAEMYAIAANNGVQIIVETHSDHFLNGVRVATKNKVIAPDKSQIYFFEKQKDSLDTVLRPIKTLDFQQ
jgi:hypothetical protein